MINLENYLNEGRIAPLYHSTNIARFRDMLTSNTIKGTTTQKAYKFAGALPKGHETTTLKYVDNDLRYFGISLTRSLPFAKKWNGNASNVILVIDQMKLTHNYKIVPFQFLQSNNMTGTIAPARSKEELGSTYSENEYEEFVLTGQKGIPLFRYLTKILVHDVDAFEVSLGSTEKYILKQNNVVVEKW